jgi:hypothetical protein
MIAAVVVGGLAIYFIVTFLLQFFWTRSMRAPRHRYR